MTTNMTNAEGLTWPEWIGAAGLYSAWENGTLAAAQAALMAAWHNGEDPTEYRAEVGSPTGRTFVIDGVSIPEVF